MDVHVVIKVLGNFQEIMMENLKNGFSCVFLSVRRKNEISSLICYKIIRVTTLMHCG